MLANGWKGSEVTRKFLSRKLEDPGYDTIRGTETNARHAAEFMYKISSNQLINPWVSMQLKVLLGRQLDKTKLAAGLPSMLCSVKSGWCIYFTICRYVKRQIKYVWLFYAFKDGSEWAIKILAVKLHELIGTDIKKKFTDFVERSSMKFNTVNLGSKDLPGKKICFPVQQLRKLRKWKPGMDSIGYKRGYNHANGYKCRQRKCTTAKKDLTST